MNSVHHQVPGEVPTGRHAGLRRKETTPGKHRVKRATAAEVCASRWRCIQRLFVTIGDDACMVATQIINLAQATSDSIEVDRAERQERQAKAERLKLYSESGIRPEEGTEVEGGSDATQGDRESAAKEDHRTEPTLTAKEQLSSPEVEAVPELESQVVSLLIDCVSQLPVKTGIYASLVGLLYKKARMRRLCSRIVDAAMTRFHEALTSGNFTAAKLILRFFLGLASSYVLALEPVINLIKALLGMANELPQTTAEHVAQTAMSSLPWLSVSLYESHHAVLVEVLDCPSTKADDDAAILAAAVQPLTAFGTDDSSGSANGGIRTPPLALVDRLASLLDAIDSMIDAEWHSRTTLRFYQSSELLPLLKAEGLEAPPLLELPSLELTVEMLKKLRTPPLQSVLRLPATLEKVDVPLKPHDQWILEDHILTTLKTFEGNVALCAEQLLRIPVEHQQFEYMLVECLLSELLRLPRGPVVRRASDTPFLYARILQRVCQLQHSVIEVAEVLLSSLVKRAIDFDHETILNVADFFGYWLNAWGGTSRLLEEWLDVAKPAPATRLLVQLSLEKAMRINYPDALATTLPACARELCPPRPIPVHPYLKLTPAPGAASSVDSATDAGSEAKPTEAPPSRLGEIEFLELRKLLRFSFESEDQRLESARAVYSLLLSFIGTHKSKGPGRNSPDREEGEQLRNDCAMDQDGDGGGGEEEGSSDTAREVGVSVESEQENIDADDKERKTAGREEREATVDCQPKDESPLNLCVRDETSPPWSREECVQLLTYALLTIGSKTMTHMQRLLKNYSCIFAWAQAGTPLEESELDASAARQLQLDADISMDRSIQPCVLDVIQRYWAMSQQKQVLSLHLFAKEGILSRLHVLELLCSQASENKRSWAHLESIQTLFRGALDTREAACEGAGSARPAEVEHSWEIEELLHRYLLFLIREIQNNDDMVSRFFYLRAIYIARKYSEYIDLRRLRDEVGMLDDSRVQNILTVITQVRRHYYFLDLDQGPMEIEGIDVAS